MAGNTAFVCEDFTVQGPGGVQLNPGWSTGNFNLNSYPVPIALYNAPYQGTPNDPYINGGPNGSVFTLGFFGQNTVPGSPAFNKWYWSYTCSSLDILEVQIIFQGVQQVGPIYKDQYTIFVRMANNTGAGTQERAVTGLLALGDGSLYCTVFPFAIRQGTNSDLCTICI